LNSQNDTVVQVNGLTEKSNPRPILGYTDRETVKLDFDNMPFKQVKYWASRVAKWFRLNGFLVLKSSEKSYHVIFDRPVSWRKNVSIVAWVSLQTKHTKLTGWFILQCIKQGSTLRISPKRDKPTPRVVYRSGTQNCQILGFLRYRALTKAILADLK